MAWVRTEDERAAAHLPIIYDPQTSGGLLVALPAAAADRYCRELRALGHSAVAVIGSIREAETSALPSAIRVVVRGTRLTNIIGGGSVPTGRPDAPPPSTNQSSHDTPESKTMSDEPASAPSQDSCCTEPPTPRAIDPRAKKLMSIALSVAQRCKPCLEIHIKGALAMGITKGEIDEAAQLAVTFAGCPASMLYKEVCAELKL